MNYPEDYKNLDNNNYYIIYFITFCLRKSPDMLSTSSYEKEILIFQFRSFQYLF